MIGWHTRHRSGNRQRESPVTHDNLIFASNMRNLKFTWRKIAHELGMTEGTIKAAYHKWQATLKNKPSQ